MVFLSLVHRLRLVPRFVKRLNSIFAKKQQRIRFDLYGYKVNQVCRFPLLKPDDMIEACSVRNSSNVLVVSVEF